MEPLVNEYDVQESIQRQKAYCQEHQLPHFAPENGKCWKCNRNIYSPIEITQGNGNPMMRGIKTENAGKHLVTGCPHCSKSYCD